MNDNTRVRVLFVTMGNICRSPTALASSVSWSRMPDSSTASRSTPLAPMPTTRVNRRIGERSGAALRRGIEMHDLRARRARSEDFDYFDYILAMDQDNYHSLSSICPEGRGLERRLMSLMDCTPQMRVREVPDPYYSATAV